MQNTICLTSSGTIVDGKRVDTKSRPVDPSVLAAALKAKLGLLE